MFSLNAAAAISHRDYLNGAHEINGHTNDRSELSRLQRRLPQPPNPPPNSDSPNTNDPPAGWANLVCTPFGACEPCPAESVSSDL